MDSYLKLVDPLSCIPPHRVSHWEHVDELCASMEENGWLGPSLVGYYWQGHLQLLSGTHRCQAAILAKPKMLVPVRIYDAWDVQMAWGNLDKWTEIMNA
jgi:hypothetical protein